MPKKENPSFDVDIEKISAQVRTALGGDTAELLASASSATSYRVRRLAASEARLADSLGAEHPRVVDLRQRRERIEAVDKSLRFERQRIVDERPLRPDEWLATGRVVADTGQPLVGFRVFVFDGDQGSNDVLGDELTDDAGEFRAEYHRRDFADKGDAEVPQLMLRILDSNGKVVFATKTAVPANSTRRNRFEIMLSRSGPYRRNDGGTCAATTTTGTPCKNPARPGSDLCAVHARAAKRSS